MVLSSAPSNHRNPSNSPRLWFHERVNAHGPAAPADVGPIVDAAALAAVDAFPESGPSRDPLAVVPRSGGIDALRVIAAAMVLIYHGHGMGIISVPLVGTAGREGVILFFVISAYVLYRPMIDGGPNLEAYALRRFTRIYPAYVAALFGSMLLLALPLTPAYFVFGQTVDLMVPSVLPASWTLQVEVVFYLLLPFVAALIRPIRWRGPLLLIASAYLYVVVALITPAAVKTGPWQFAWFAWVFPLGMAAALVRRRTTWLLPVAVVVLVGALSLEWSQPLDMPVAIAGVLLVLGIRDVSVPRWLSTAGTRLSYPVYLWHAAILTVVANFWIGVAATLLVSALSWVVIERPFQSIRLGGLRRQPAPAGATVLPG
jgi:peptidoglycan/LPS O-acetylase OafA/YrhL